MQANLPFFGADVGKFEIVLARHGQGRPVTVPNTPSAIRSWLRQAPEGSCLAMEATGGYQSQ